MTNGLCGEAKMTHTYEKVTAQNYPGETSEPSWDRFLLQPQEKPTPREAEPSAL